MIFIFSALPVFTLKLTGTYMYQWADTSTFFRTFLDTCAIISILEDEHASSAIFMKPNDGCASDEDSANENDRGLIDNFLGSQLNAPAEALLSDRRRIKVCQTDRSSKSILMRSKFTNNLTGNLAI